ncbi:CoA-binding protein [Flavivirga amylovorans]|uniref:CoA-binding protein n=1 Tax=Flavivirga amylovorans TaxID=870486 RepID=A0ABT8WXC2_9FLAO|nr:CoA-binding protein [Flavivirga amylovorans]MDO5986342.1 CoA-binding protein [Flavivirga amylovorans]
MKKKTLVLGASLKPNRYSNYAIQRLVANKFETVAFGLKKGDISGILIDTELLPYKDVHTVTLYLNSKRQKDYYNYVVSLKPERVIFNPGTENPEFYKILKENNILFEAACTLVLLSTNQY